jgi:phage antirepressor YoqD-like protein
VKTKKPKLKTRLHFNRVNMSRGNPNVWTAHNSHGCFQAEKLVVMHNGEIVAETVFDPKGKQPRAYFVARAKIKYRGSTAIVEV